MNKKLIKTIATTFTVCTFITTAPTVNLNIFATKAYADTSDGISRIEVENSGGNSLNLYDSNDYKNKIDNDALVAGRTYFAKTSTDNIKINVSGDSDKVRIFKGTSDSTKGERPDRSFSLSETTTFIIRAYSENPGVAKYSNSSYISQYRIKVKYTGSDDEEEGSNVYLSSISLSSGSINFSKKTTSYDINVGEDINKITIGARPDCDSNDYDNYKVRINGVKVGDDDKFKEEVTLKEGKNVIEVKVEDNEDNTKIYTLNITRGGSIAGNTVSSSGGADAKNKWVQANGRWQYKDAAGNIVKNSWIQNYFVQTDGFMATGWLSYGGKWYYLGSDGAKKTGWQLVNGSWYYLDSQGIMQIGWIRDKDGKYYYLNSDGSMAYNTIIGGYKLGSDGAWIQN